MTTGQDKIHSSQAQLDETLQRFANGFSWVRRAPVFHSPSEHGLEYEDVTLPARALAERESRAADRARNLKKTAAFFAKHQS